MDPVHNRLLVNQRLDEMKTALEPVCFEDFDTKPSLKYLLSFCSTSPMMFKQSVSSVATTSSARSHPGWLRWRQTLRSATCRGEQNIIFLSSDNATFRRSELEVKGTEEYQKRVGLPSSFNGLGGRIDLWQEMTEDRF